MSISLDAANALESAIDGKIKKAATGRRRASGTVSRVDRDGTVYAVLESGIETVVEGLTASVNPGDTVNVTIEDGRAEVLGNYSDPSAGVQYVRAVEGIATEAGATAHAAVDSAAAARQVADEANKVAQATNQHFFADDNGAHITDVTQDEWAQAVADNFSDYDPTTKPYHNQLLNSLGILLRTALNNLVSITRSAIAFYDGQGNAASNIVARFGSDGAQIGKNDTNRLELGASSLRAYDADGNLYFNMTPDGLTADQIDVNDDLRQALLQVANLVIGSTDGTYISANGNHMSFMSGGNEVAYIDIDPNTNEAVFYMTRSVVVKDMQFGNGNWKWYSRENGNMSLKWIGDV